MKKRRKTYRYVPSIIQTVKECYLCGRKTCLERHECFPGTANRRISIQNGFWCYLCADDHRGVDGAQYNSETAVRLKQDCQRAYEETHTREEFMALIGKNYL